MAVIRATLLACGLLLAACGAAGPATDGVQDGRAGAQSQALPSDIVRALQTDERVLDCAQGRRDGRSAFASDWVRWRQPDLDGDGRADWLVEGVHPCLRRDGAADWWIYADTPDGRRLLGRVRDVHAVEALPARSQGYADLRVRGAQGERILRYRDDGYQEPGG